MTQSAKILDFLKSHNGITSYEAFRYLNITRLAARISDLRRQGHEIYSQKEMSVNQDGKTVYYDRYRLRKEQKDDAC